MNKLSLSICLAFAFFVASAVAQMAPRGTQGTQPSSPSMSQQPSQYPTQGTSQTSPDQNATTQNQANGEHTIKGCVQSQGGSYVLETKKGKEIALTGTDVSAHVGHEVALKGTWEGEHAMGSTEAGSSTSNAGAAAKTFNVSSVKHLSKTCKGSTGSSPTSSPSGTSPNSAQPPQ